MTKMLSQLLEAREPEFRQGVNELERASGAQGHDIRLATDVLTASRAKLAALGLDPRDTTAPELYHALNEKLKVGDKELAEVLQLDPSDANYLEAFTRVVKRLTGERETFALKSSVVKRLLKAHPPRKTLKALSYRSLDSMLRRESPASLLAAARIAESAGWYKSLVDDYKKLGPSDFEIRPVRLEALSEARWRELSSGFVAGTKHNLIEIREIGTVVVLPLPEYVSGMLTALFLLTVNSINDCLAAGSYLRLYQVNADFGDQVARAVSDEIELDSPIAGKKLSWRAFHDFVSDGSNIGLDPEITNEKSPFARPEELLANLSPQLEFWRGSGHLAILLDGQIVSLNPIDAALNYVNSLPFESRVAHHYKANLWQAFWRRYLQAGTLAEKLSAGWRRELAEPELALEPVMSEEFEA